MNVFKQILSVRILPVNMRFELIILIISLTLVNSYEDIHDVNTKALHSAQELIGHTLHKFTNPLINILNHIANQIHHILKVHLS